MLHLPARRAHASRRLRGGGDARHTSLDCAIDYDLWIRLSSQGARFIYLEEQLATSRMHADNKSLGRRGELYQESIALAKRHFGYVPMSWLGPSQR